MCHRNHRILGFDRDLIAEGYGHRSMWNRVNSLPQGLTEHRCALRKPFPPGSRPHWHFCDDQV